MTVLEAGWGVDAIWLSGSLAAGAGDEFSDLDVHVATAGPAAQDWTAIARDAGAVFARARTGSTAVLVNAVTDEGARFDLVVHPTAELDRGVQDPVAVLRDARGILARVPRRDSRQAPRAEEVVAGVEEFLRSLLLLGVVGPREEWLSAEAGSLWMLNLLTNLMRAENGEAAGGSALRLNRRLTDEQKDVLWRLPPLAPSRISVVAFQMALARDFLPRARRLCEQLGAPFPARFEAAVRRRLDGVLDPGGTATASRTRTRPAGGDETRYDGVSEWYDARFAGYGDLSDSLSSSSELIRLLGPGGGPCLDVACGGGLHHPAVASTGRQPIIGIDLSMDQLRVAHSRGVARLAQASATGLPFPDQTLTTVVCTYLHTDVDDMVPVLAEVWRVLRPGGRVVYLGVHPCFWGHFVENPFGPGRIVHPGYLDTGWIDSPYWRDSAGLRAKVGARHVTTSELVNAFLRAGLSLEQLHEPESSSGHADRIGITATRPHGR